MNRDFLRNLGIDEDHIPKILDEHHDSLKEYKESASKVDDLTTQLNTANEEISNRDKQIEDLKTSNKDDEALQKQLAELEKENNGYAEKLKTNSLNSAIQLAVAKDANDPSDVLALLDKEGLELDEDGKTVKGLDDKVAALRESKPYLFEQPKGKTGRTPEDGDNPGAISKEQFNSMSYDEKAELYQKQPEVFNQLSN